MPTCCLRVFAALFSTRPLRRTSKTAVTTTAKTKRAISPYVLSPVFALCWRRGREELICSVVFGVCVCVCVANHFLTCALYVLLQPFAPPPSSQDESPALRWCPASVGVISRRAASGHQGLNRCCCSASLRAGCVCVCGFSCFLSHACEHLHVHVGFALITARVVTLTGTDACAL